MFAHICQEQAKDQHIKAISATSSRASSADPMRRSNKKTLKKRSQNTTLKNTSTFIMNNQTVDNTSCVIQDLKSGATAHQINRFDFDCFKKFLVRLTRKCLP